jgi:tetratricopeptide (TPR) repeat protein
MSDTTRDDPFKKNLIAGTRLLNRGKPNEALPLLELAYRDKPENLEAALNYGSAYIMAGRFKYAVPILEEAAKLHPDAPQLWQNLGAAYLGNPIIATDEQQTKALAALNRAVLLDPFAPNIEYNIGLIHRDRGEFDQAVNAFKRALKINPRDNDARSLLRKLEAHLNENDASQDPTGA